MKKCTSCGELKEFSEFYKEKRLPSGLSIYCKVCMNKKTKAWKDKNKEKIAAYNKDYYNKDVDYQLRRCKEWALKNWQKYRLSNRKACRKYAMSNKAKITARAAKRRGLKRNATPSWLTKEHLEEIKDLYIIAEMFKIYSGIPYNVDHIIPLNSDKVCGLHVPWNLQIIPAIENFKKSNKLLEEYLV